MLLLKITTTPIEYRLEVEKPSLKPLDNVKNAEHSDSAVKASKKLTAQSAKHTAVRSDTMRMTGGTDTVKSYQSYYAPQQPAAKSVKFHAGYSSSIEEVSSHISEIISDSEGVVTESTPKMEYVPGSMKVEIEHLAKVDCEYLGGIDYFPASSAPDYEA